MKEKKRHAYDYIPAAPGGPDRGDTDSPCPEVTELHRCLLSHYNGHSRIGSLTGPRSFPGRKMSIPPAGNMSGYRSRQVSGFIFHPK
jgi:hypothetical protein